jgi:(R,R)-butanediol dehydrogenase / meso-butanediol dehydrogenase / diacetyl reductase
VRALRFHAARDLRIEEVAEPSAPGVGEVVVRIASCGICGTDLHEYAAGPIVTPVEPHPLNGAQNPQILGHEFAGDVVATGPGVTRVVEGDRVAIMPLSYCGNCTYCRRGLQHLCATMACVGLSHPWGGMAELAAVAEYQVVRLPDSVTYRQGALIEPTAVAAYGVERAGVGPGDSVLVTGAGPIGALAALCAHSAGASTVYVSEPNAARRARAEALGVAIVLDPTSDDVPALLRDQTDGLGVDVAIECSGHPAGFATAISALRRRGTLAQTGLFVGEASVEPYLWSLNDLTIVGTWCYWVYDFDRIASQIATGSLPVERVITSGVRVGDCG